MAAPQISSLLTKTWDHTGGNTRQMVDEMVILLQHKPFALLCVNLVFL